jgi:DNA-binding Lrp family transcriptional regulator
MGLIAMSERDLQRIEVLSKVVERRMTIVAAAHVLALSPRQVRRLLERLQTDGAAAIRHKACGRPSNNRISGGVRDYAMVIVRERSGSLLDDKPTGRWLRVIGADAHLTFAVVVVLGKTLLLRKAN